MRLRTLRRTYNYTQADIAKVLHCKQNTYSQYETTTRCIPIDALKLLAELYETSIDFLVDFTDVSIPYPRKK
jgi:transcriptional regulator with XRE-family HTH domain